MNKKKINLVDYLGIWKDIESIKMDIAMGIKTYNEILKKLEYIYNLADGRMEEKIRENWELTDELDKYREALIWCSGSDDFQEGGKARRGWVKMCRPLLHKDYLEEGRKNEQKNKMRENSRG